MMRTAVISSSEVLIIFLVHERKMFHLKTSICNSKQFYPDCPNGYFSAYCIHNKAFDEKFFFSSAPPNIAFYQFIWKYV